MRRYEGAWRVVWSVVAALGVALAVLETSAVGVLLVLALVFPLCCVVRRLVPDALRGPPPLTVTIGLLALAAYGRVSLPLDLLLVLVAGVSSPAVVRRAIGAARGPVRLADRETWTEPNTAGPVEEGCSLTVPESLGPLRGLDDRQLCRLWRESFWALGGSGHPGSKLCVVSLREACLDELERRHAEALHAWLDSGARASSGPEKYLDHPPPFGSEAA
jgi:hypothetical protein